MGRECGCRMTFVSGATMLKHIFRFVGLKGVHVWVKIAPAPIVFSRADIDRKQAAEEAREAVLALMSGDAVAPEAAEAAEASLHG